MLNMSIQARATRLGSFQMLKKFGPAVLLNVVSATVLILLFQNMANPRPDVSRIGSADVSRVSQQVLSREPTLIDATDSSWSVSANGTSFAQVNGCESGYALINNRCLYLRQNLLVINAQADNFSYAYGPSIIYTQGVFHMYFCSLGTKGWDDTRHATSSDLINWSTPEIVLNPTPLERANCDPSVVLYDAGDGPYYYLFYGGNILNVQTVTFVARSASPAGPFLKDTDRGTWEVNPPDSHVIFWPFHATPDKGNIYGAGQPTVVVMNGMLYMWYTDSTQTISLVNGQWTNQVYRIYFVTSYDGINWSAPIAVVENDFSVDVKFDPVSGQFFMF
jgi:hypothetical protein